MKRGRILKQGLDCKYIEILKNRVIEIKKGGNKCNGNEKAASLYEMVKELLFFTRVNL